MSDGDVLSPSVRESRLFPDKDVKTVCVGLRGSRLKSEEHVVLIDIEIGEYGIPCGACDRRRPPRVLERQTHALCTLLRWLFSFPKERMTEDLFGVIFLVVGLVIVLGSLVSIIYYYFNTSDVRYAKQDLTQILEILDAADGFTRDNRTRIDALLSKPVQQRTEKEAYTLESLVHDTCYIYHRMGIYEAYAAFTEKYPVSTWDREGDVYKEFKAREALLANLTTCQNVELGEESMQQMSHAYYIYQHLERITSALTKLDADLAALSNAETVSFQRNMILYEICLILYDSQVLSLYQSYTEKYGDDNYLQVIFRTIPYEVLQMVRTRADSGSCDILYPTARERVLVNKMIRILRTNPSILEDLVDPVERAKHPNFVANLQEYNTNANYTASNYFRFRLYKDLEYDLGKIQQLELDTGSA